MSGGVLGAIGQVNFYRIPATGVVLMALYIGYFGTDLLGPASWLLALVYVPVVYSTWVLMSGRHLTTQVDAPGADELEGVE